MPKAAEVKRGMAIVVNDQAYIVKKIDVHSPSARGASTLYKMRLAHAVTKQKAEQTYKGDEMISLADLERRPVSFSYMDGDSYVFMDDEDFSQYMLDAESLGDDSLYIYDGLTGLTGLKIDDHVVGVEMPATVELEFIETAQGIKGASASSRTKPANLSTGLIVQVPEYLEVGEVIKINTAEKTYISRA